jgi:uncharacterized protein YciU (UPF0263 family)
VPDVYKDAVQPAAQAGGHALGTLMNAFNMLLAPLERAQLRSEAKTERLRQELAKGFEEIPEERRVEPPLEVIGPALESLKYVEDETLQDMFAQLLIAAMDSERQHRAHRAFVKIIAELSPNDAQILKQIYDNKLRIAIKDTIYKIDEYSPLATDSYIPISLKNDYDYDEDSLISSCIDNLLRLKIIDITHMTYKQFAFNFEKEENILLSQYLEAWSEKIGYDINETWEQFEPSLITITSFGFDFCMACIS